MGKDGVAMHMRCHALQISVVYLYGNLGSRGLGSCNPGDAAMEHVGNV